jgi:hypothetical protein
MPSVAPVKGVLALLLLAAASDAMAAQFRAPLYDSTSLNIGLNCRWERKCIARQQRAMNRALAYVRKQRPPQMRIHLCNRNASRGRYRVDWIGFDNCIRNASLHMPSARSFRRRSTPS